MFDDLDPRSPNPLYAQIASRVRVAVAAGELDEGDSLPSVRQLARMLRVNPATVVQAYHSLESEGFVEMRHGAGTFVRAVSTPRKEAERRRRAREIARRALSEGARLGLAGAEILSALEAEIGTASGADTDDREGALGVAAPAAAGADSDGDVS